MKEKNLTFQYDTLVDRQNICDRVPEAGQMLKYVLSRRRFIIYAPRRYGKTSLLKNMIGDDFCKQVKKPLVIYFNFMDVSSFTSIAERMQAGIKTAIEQSTKVKALLETARNYLKNFRVALSVDPLTNAPVIEIKGDYKQPVYTVGDLFKTIENLCEDYKVFLIMDEFQDIAYVNEAEAVFRTHLQEITNTPVALLGSKRRLLSEMFASAHSPFFNYGTEFILKPIALNDWLPYFNERLKQKKTKMTREAMAHLLEVMCDVPNSICEVGAWLLDHQDEIIDVPQLSKSLAALVASKEQSFRFQISALSEKEKIVCQALAKSRYVRHILGKDFSLMVKTAASATRKIITKLERHGYVEWEVDNGYRLANPLLGYFLAMYPL